MEQNQSNNITRTLFLINAILVVLVLYVATYMYQTQAEKRVLTARNKVQGISSVNAQESPHQGTTLDDAEIPDQRDVKALGDFVNKMLMGIPDATPAPNVTVGPAGPGGPGGPGGDPVGPVTPRDPPGLAEKITVDGYDYYQLPESPDGSYDIYSCPARRYGSRELVQVLYAVAKRYHEMTGGADSLWIGDLNAAGHKSHKWGIAVDLVTTGMGSMMLSDGYNPTFAKYLGEAFVSTGMMKNIWYCDQEVVDHVTAFARDRNLPLQQMYCIEGHNDHFHVDINIEGGPEYTPGC